MWTEIESSQEMSSRSWMSTKPATTAGFAWLPKQPRAVPTARCTALPTHGRGASGRLERGDLPETGVKVVKLPVNIPPERFIGGGCGLPTALHAVQQAGIQLGDSVVVQGSGPVGLSAAILAQLSGACQLIVVGAPQLRLDMALEMGVDAVINIEEHGPEERIELVRELTSGRGADVTIEASGNPHAVTEGMRMTRDMAVYRRRAVFRCGDVTINPHWDINRKHWRSEEPGESTSAILPQCQGDGETWRSFPLGKLVSGVTAGSSQTGACGCGSAESDQGGHQA